MYIYRKKSEKFYLRILYTFRTLKCVKKCDIIYENNTNIVTFTKLTNGYLQKLNG